ncbi:MAG: zinc-binding dehydrogenase, partial [Kutzneria sp.]|nr:zinc-binding dehydrogenase [Kutzneria sp.]
QEVMVIGADGAVGSVLLHLLADTGVRILATAKPATAARVRGLGADEVIDYTTADFLKQARRMRPHGVDLAVDLVNAGAGVGRTAKLVRPNGRVLSTLGGPTEFDRGVTAHYLGAVDGFGQLQSVVDKVACGELPVEISAYPFDQAVTAVIDFARKRASGRVVVTL